MTRVTYFLNMADDIMVNYGGDVHMAEKAALECADGFCCTNDSKDLYDIHADYSGMALNISSDEICEILKSHIADALMEIYDRA